MSENQFHLRLQKGPDPGAKFPLTSGSLTIGRDPMADITLNDPEVSRQHARMFETEKGYQIQDLGSTNGTFVNGEKISMELVDLTSGATIVFGSGVVLLFESIREESELLEAALDLSPREEDHPTDVTNLDIEPEPVIEPLPEAVAGFDLDVDSDFGTIEDSDDITPEILEQIGREPVIEPMSEAVAEFDLDGDSGFSEMETIDDIQEEPEIVDGSVSGSRGISAATDKPPKNRRTIIIVLAILFLIICCCCSFLVFMYFIGGDWLLTQLGA